MMLHQGVYQRLQEVARSKGTITYSEVAPLAALDMSSPADRATLAAILDEVNVHEQNEGRPMLSATVVLAEKNMPGHGFFECAARLGHGVGEDELTYWLGEIRRVHDYWSTS